MSVPNVRAAIRIAISVGSPAGSAFALSRALLQLAAIRPNACTDDGAALPNTATLPSSRSIRFTGTHAATGIIRFSVNVPVLSVQITSVEPNVSTAERRLTSAPRPANCRTATANDSVITGSKPSGTIPASRPAGDHAVVGGG